MTVRLVLLVASLAHALPDELPVTGIRGVDNEAAAQPHWPSTTIPQLVQHSIAPSSGSPSEGRASLQRSFASIRASYDAALRAKDEHIELLEQEIRLLTEGQGERPMGRDVMVPPAAHTRRMSEALPSPPSAPPTVPLVCPCIDVYPVGVTSDLSNAFLVDIQGESFSYPPRYGLNCSAHDAGLRPFCDITINGAFSPLDNPRWCSRSWCYVNASDCNVAYTSSDYIPGFNLSYSYNS